MQTSVLICPKCSHTRLPHETAEPERCPACGIYFAKWAQRETTLAQIAARHENPESLADDDTTEPGVIGERLRHVPDYMDNTRILASAGLLALLAVWGGYLFTLDYRDGEMFSSFMHNILLVIHECGHAIFMPFGEFMTILGGSLFQVLLPLICAGAFFWTNRDTFGAGIGVWWAGTSLLDLAPYIYDAKEPQLILLGGHTGEDGPHDWIYLLEALTGSVQKSQGYGAFAHTLGLLVMLAGLGWAAHTLWRWHCHLQAHPRPI